MAQIDVAIPLIELIALFLPAWAVVMQVFTKLVKDANLKQNPLLIPFFSLGFSLSGMSLYLFGRAGNRIMVFLTKEGVVEGSESLAEALLGVGLGGLAFVGLGVMVLMAVGFHHISYPELHYVGVLSFIFLFIMWGGWVFDRPILMLATLTIVVGISQALLVYAYPREEGATGV